MKTREEEYNAELCVVEEGNYRLRHARKQLGLTQAALAEAAGVQQTSVSSYERMSQPVSITNAKAIAFVLCLKPQELFPDHLRYKNEVWSTYHKRWFKRESMEKKLFFSECSLETLSEEDLPSVEMDELVPQSFLAQAIREVIGELSRREQEVLRMRFGFYNGHDMTLKEVGHAFGVTVERIRQVQIKALRKLRHPIRSRKLHPFVYP